MARYSFGKDQKLKSRKEINLLFKEGSSTFIYPFRIFYTKSSLETDRIYPQVLIGVPKKHFKKAVIRNLLKRRIREAYRLNKEMLLVSKKEQHLISPFNKLGIIYVGKEEMSFQFINEKLFIALERLTTTFLNNENEEA